MLAPLVAEIPSFLQSESVVESVSWSILAEDDKSQELDKDQGGLHAESRKMNLQTRGGLESKILSHLQFPQTGILKIKGGLGIKIKSRLCF